jgi:hypothetical protein
MRGRWVWRVWEKGGDVQELVWKPWGKQVNWNLFYLFFNPTHALFTL